MRRIRRTNRKLIDWAMVETEFRAGQISICRIAKNFGISPAAIRKHALKLGWQRDLKDRIKERVKQKVYKGSFGLVPNLYEKLANQHILEEDIVEIAAARTLGVVDLHKKTSEKLREQVARLSGLLTYYKGTNLLDLVQLANTARTLSAALETLVQIERKAYGLDDKEDDSGKGMNVLIIEDTGAHLVGLPQPEAIEGNIICQDEENLRETI